MDTMKALMKVAPAEGAELREVPIPQIGPDEVLIRVQATSICGTDLHIYFWDPWAASRIKPPMIFGHEVAGEVVEVGSQVKGIRVGDFVSVETHIACGTCYQCRTGQKHLCANLKIVGVDTDGAFAEYLKVPYENAWKNDPSLPPEIATLQEPFGNAVYTTLAEDVAGKQVAVFGGGPIGLMAVGVARASGASDIFLVEPTPLRRELGRTMGANHLIDPLQDDPVAYILDHTHGKGVDVFLEMSGAPKALEQGFQALRKGGRASLLGIFPEPFEVDINNLIVFKGATIYGINGRIMFDTWYRASELLASGRVDLRPLITHQIPLEEFATGMNLLRRKEAVKIVMKP